MGRFNMVKIWQRDSCAQHENSFYYKSNYLYVYYVIYSDSLTNFFLKSQKEICKPFPEH